MVLHICSTFPLQNIRVESGFSRFHCSVSAKCENISKKSAHPLHRIQNKPPLLDRLVRKPHENITKNLVRLKHHNSSLPPMQIKKCASNYINKAEVISQRSASMYTTKYYKFTSVVDWNLEQPLLSQSQSLINDKKKLLKKEWITNCHTNKDSKLLEKS